MAPQAQFKKKILIPLAAYCKKRVEYVQEKMEVTPSELELMAFSNHHDSVAGAIVRRWV